MSSNLVKRLLRVSAESLEPKEERPQKRRRQKNPDGDETPAATKEEIVASRVRQMLALDRMKKGPSVIAAKSRQQKLKEEKETKKLLSSAIVTNSRSAALQATKEHEKTSTKKTQQKEKEERRLQNIAKTLKKLNKGKNKKK
eukprot:scaffold41684_cov160-Amphora_coffeaeformis.AAC.1